MGTVTEPTARLQELAVATTAFQTWAGVDPTAEIEVRKAAARLKVQMVESDKLSPSIMPFMLLYRTPYDGTRRSGGGNAFRAKFAIEAVFFDRISAEQDATRAARSAALLAFGETVYGIVSAMAALSGTADHLLVNSYTELMPPTLNGFDVDEEDSVDWPYVVNVYRFDIDRWGAQTV